MVVQFVDAVPDLITSVAFVHVGSMSVAVVGVFVLHEVLSAGYDRSICPMCAAQQVNDPSFSPTLRHTELLT
jgi:hypothetical protein